MSNEILRFSWKLCLRDSQAKLALAAVAAMVTLFARLPPMFQRCVERCKLETVFMHMKSVPKRLRNQCVPNLLNNMFWSHGFRDQCGPKRLRNQCVDNPFAPHIGLLYISAKIETRFRFETSRPLKSWNRKKRRSAAWRKPLNIYTLSNISYNTIYCIVQHKYTSVSYIIDNTLYI